MVSQLAHICHLLDEEEPKKDKNFWVADLHGMETYQDYKIPSGVRIIMFCHARYLDMRPEFEDFVWEHIYLNRDTSFNYCTFLSTLALYPSLRDHFCVYNSGDVITDLYLFEEKKNEFRTGVFQLPVRIAVKKDDTIFVSSEDVFQPTLEASKGIRKILVDPGKTARYSREPDSQVKFFSSSFSIPNLKMSDIITFLQEKSGDLTLLVMACRTSKRPHRLTSAPRVYEELEKMYEKLSQKREKPT